MKVKVFTPRHEREKEARDRKIPAELPKIGQHMLICAPTGSGKSQLLANLLAGPYAGVFTKIYFFHPQWQYDIYKDIFENVPEERIKEAYSDNDIDAILAETRDDIAEERPSFPLIILDDSMDAWRSSRRLNDILTWCRHLGVTVWAAVQYLKGCMSKLARTQFTSTIVFASAKQSDVDLLAEMSPAGKAPFVEALRKVRARNAEEGHTYNTLHMNSRHPRVFFANMDEPLDAAGPSGSE